MKRFNPEKEINNRFDGVLILLLVIGCCCLAMVGISFSYKLIDEDKESYKINLEIINGLENEYHNEVLEGTFATTIRGKGEFDNITCVSGSAEYDRLTETIKFPYINSDTNCVISFKSVEAKYLSVDGLKSTNDNSGISYYYTGDAENNYVKFNNLMFRIVRVNGDGSLRIILNESTLKFNYGGTNNFQNSNLKRVLNEWYKENIKDVKYLVLEDFDVNNYDQIEGDNLISLAGSYYGAVGTLSVKEANFILKDTSKNYLGDGLLLANGAGATEVYTLFNNSITKSSIVDEFVVKPVINIYAKDYNGEGTIDNPYTIKEE